jgi:polysaccharide biosynthesis acetyltransferase WcbI-like protein
VLRKMTNSSIVDPHERRRVVGFVGNCQAELLSKVFRAMVPVAEFRVFYHFFDVPADTQESCLSDLRSCDDLLLQGIQDVEDYPLHSAIGTPTRVHSFPFLRFASLWPYDDFNGLRDTLARAQDNPELHTTTYYDGVLGRLRQRVPESESRLAAYRSLDVRGIVDPIKVHDFEVRRLEGLDQRYGCAIGQLILDGFRETPLFYTVNRPCGPLLAKVLRYILEVLRLDLGPLDDKPLDELRAIQVPVHPLVAQRLGVRWADDTTRYGDGPAVTWEEFVRAYICRYG